MYLVPQSEIKIGNMRFFGGNTGINAVEIDTSVKKLVSTAKITLPANFKNSEGKKITELMHVGDKAEIRLGYNGKHLLREKSRAEVRRILDNAEQYRTLKANPMYKDVDFDWKTGGLKATHVGHNGTHPNDKQRFFGNLSNSDLEKECQQTLFDWGHIAILQDENLLDKDNNTLPALDLELDGKLIDIKSITENNKNTIQNAIREKRGQLKNVYEKTGKYSDEICLYFHDSSMFDLKTVEEAFNNYKELGGRRVQAIRCVVNGNTNLITIR